MKIKNLVDVANSVLEELQELREDRKVKDNAIFSLVETVDRYGDIIRLKEGELHLLANENKKLKRELVNELTRDKKEKSEGLRRMIYHRDLKIEDLSEEIELYKKQIAESENKEYEISLLREQLQALKRKNNRIKK